MGDMDDIVKEFLVESNENLDQMDRDLIALEKDPASRDILSRVFRTIHTIKGTSGFLAFAKLESVTHVGESLLSLLRDGKLGLTAEITSALLAMVDAVRQMLGNIEASGHDGDQDYREPTQLLASLQPLPASKVAPAVPSPTAALAGASSSDLGPESPAPDEPHRRIGEILIETANVAPEQVAAAMTAQRTGDPRRLGEILVERGAVKPSEVLDALKVQGEAHSPVISESSIRVDVGLLDKLMNLVGELVLARNQVLQFSTTQQDSTFLNTTQRLNLITTELQESLMKTRMQPIGNIWSKFPRVVRDLATACGKQIRLEMEGKETELDKTLIEAIKDPLTHLVRNAVDHGIELPKRRLAAGKPAEGRLFLRAFHEGGQVNIEISDDGAGIDMERVKAKAIEKGLIVSEQAARMSDRELVNLIFLPGLSTAEKVTNVSGRGVGMDVVKTNMEKISGTIDIQNRPGQGITLKIKIPLTLAIIPALIVTSGGDRYAIPQVSLLELVRLEGEQARKGIEMIHGAPVYRLRGRLLPLVYLKRELRGGIDAQTASTAGGPGESQAELLDFAMARSKHYQWFDRLRQFLDGKATLTVEQAGSHKDCALGKWLYSSSLQKYGDIPEMQELEKSHAGYHVLVKNIVTLKTSGQHAQAEQEFTDVKPTSEKIVGLLTTVEKKVLESQNVNIVVLQADDRQFGLVVDEINDTEEIVVKPLGKQLKGISTFAGATIMGDGRVALILDVLGLAQRANVVSGARDRGRGEKVGETEIRHEEGESLLLLRGPDNGRMALPLSLVARLEEFNRSSVEKAEGRDVVQYRGQILPLIHLSSALPERRKKRRGERSTPSGLESEKIQVVVHTDQGRSVGLVVDRILDITNEAETARTHTGRKGTLGSVVVQGRVTELLDVKGLIQAADPTFQGASMQPIDVSAIFGPPPP